MHSRSSLTPSLITEELYLVIVNKENTKKTKKKKRIHLISHKHQNLIRLEIFEAQEKKKRES